MQNIKNELEQAANEMPMLGSTAAGAIRNLIAQQAEHERLIAAIDAAIERIEQALIHFNNN